MRRKEDRTRVFLRLRLSVKAGAAREENEKKAKSATQTNTTNHSKIAMQSTSPLLLVALLCTLASGFSCRTTASAPTRPTPSFASKKAPKTTRQRSRRPEGVNRQLASNTLDVIYRGGSTELQSATSEDIGGQDLELSIGNVLSSLWGTVGVSYVLLKAIKRVVPIALEPFGKGEGVIPLTQPQLM